MAEPQRVEPDTSGMSGIVAAAKAVSDPLRAGVLRVLKDESFGVLELCRVLDTAQPALSHHLKVLHEAGLVVRRREGNVLFYRRAPAPVPLHGAFLDAIDTLPVPADQAAGIEAVHRERRRQSEQFFAEHAEDFATSQARISEAAVYAPSVLDLVARLELGAGSALEIGPGDGELLAPLAERFRQVVGIDSAQEMLDRCAAAAATVDNVRLMLRDFLAMPARPRFQLVVAAMVVHHQPSPQRFFRHAREVLRRDGVLIVVELCRHEHEWARDACGDLWLGFEPAELANWAANADLTAGESQFLAQRNGFRIQIHAYHNQPR